MRTYKGFEILEVMSLPEHRTTPPIQPGQIPHSPDAVEVLIPYRNKRALLAYYLAIGLTLLAILGPGAALAVVVIRGEKAGPNEAPDWLAL